MLSSCTTRSQFSLVQTVADPERILCDQKLFRLVYLREIVRRTDESKQEPIHTLDQAFR